MNFDSTNYVFLLQDFIFAAAAGFAAGWIGCVLSVFMPAGRKVLWIRDMLTAFIFSVLVFSYVVSFANYPDVRIYHLLGALFGFLSFDYGFSAFLHKKIIKKIEKVKNKMLCFAARIFGTICVCVRKNRENNKKQQPEPKNTDLKNDNSWVYNL